MREYGSEHPAIILPDEYFDKLNELGYEMTFLRCGREALMYVGKQIGNNKVILFPSYCCWSMSAPFQKLGWRVVYYRLNNDLTIDLSYLEYLLRLEKPQAILTMNYYGSADTHKAIALAKSKNSNVQVIEDFSHCTFSIRQIWNDQVDYYVSSIRKSIGVCDGAVVLSKNACNRSYIANEDDNFADKRYIAQTNKQNYVWSNDQDVKQNFLSTIHECEVIINDFDTVHSMSERAIKMLNTVNGEQIAFARRENMKHLWKLLNGKIDMLPGLERCFDGAPFSLPIFVDNRDKVQTALAHRGVYTQLLWPVCEEARKICPVSKKMDAHMLSVPIDQRYTWNDIEEIASIIIDVVKNI